MVLMVLLFINCLFSVCLACFIYFEYFVCNVINNLNFCFTLFWNVYFSYVIVLVFIVSVLGVLISVNMLMDVSIVIGNVIWIYIVSLIVVCINGLLYGNYFGLNVFSYFNAIFLFCFWLFVFILLLVECFGIYFQSLTLSNSLTINLIAGNLLCYLVGVICLKYLLLVNNYLALIYFEFFSLFLQVFIFGLLSLEYLF